jgi:hypothetical protein
MADLHPPLGQQALHEAKGHGPGLGGIGRTEIEPHGVDDPPKTDVIVVTLLGQALQNIIRSHKSHLSIAELNLLDGD